MTKVRRIKREDKELDMQNNISVVIPVYNRPQDLSVLLGSLLEQTVKPVEVIIVDDTPTGEIRHLVDYYETSFNKSRIPLSYIRNSKERSITVARNIGIMAAIGEIILFLDSDIILHPDYIQKILETFKESPEALGVAGWIVPFHPTREDIRYHFFDVLRKLFVLFRDSKNSCSFPEYPTVLTRTTECQWFSGSNMAWRRSVFGEHEFDENLKKYAFMEDVLFSGSIHKKDPGKLLMTPKAKCIHTASEEGRMERSKLRHYKFQYRKYVLIKLFGSKGLFMFCWQNLGLLVIRLISRIRRKSTITDQFL